MVRDFGFTAEQQDQLWVQWRQRDSLRTIAMDVGTTHQKVRRFLLQSGGIRLPASKRNERHLSAADREEISRGIAAGYSAAVIATVLGRASSTVSREIHRNGGREQYRAVTADQRAMLHAKRPKPQRLDTNLMLLIVVAFKLGQDWSPEQISQWLRRTYPEDATMRLSHEAIYRSIYIAERKALARCLGRPSQHLRSGRTMRVPRPARVSNRGRLKNMVSIHARPASIEERTEVGHWEGDLVMGSRPSAVATLVDRKTRYVRLVRLPNGIKANVVRAALTSSFRALPEGQRLSLTWDRGRELAEHQELTAELNLPVYFCDKRSPWQRGTNENTNRLLRQYLPKNGDLRQFSQQDLDEMADKINTRPRKVLDWGTSAHEFQVVARRDPQASRP
ncbi:IS30 family transposase [Arthrobacter bussei]|uniref:IS30 family transposase n=1 Tax=Arthrobacter bussei TaxID=2594179 RepID=A0A7X1NPV3_9MICC|nr:IS30 family transposase [Arthrobacter bussei]MPY10743.1 IS30 family transposase [Arthrobacter bussei]